MAIAPKSASAKKSELERETEILRRMLSTPPKPHKPATKNGASARTKNLPKRSGRQ